MIAGNYSVVCVGGLNVAGVVKNHCLARSVSDAALGEFRRQLEYKTARNGAVLRAVDRWFPSSKTCSNCGTVKAKLPLGERTFNCDACGASMDRDLNAAINIKVAGSAPETLNARGEDVRRTGLAPGDADPGEARTKQACQSAVRLGAGFGNEAMRPSVSWVVTAALRVVRVGAVAGFPCTLARCCSLGLRVCLSVRAWLCVRWRVRVARFVSGGAFRCARRGVPRGCLFVGCALRCFVLPVCCCLFWLSAIVWCAFRERTCVWCDMVHVGLCGCAFGGNRDCRLFFTV